MDRRYEGAGARSGCAAFARLDRVARAGLLLLPILVTGAVGCFTNPMQKMVEDTAGVVMDSDDPETVRAGLPTFLLMIEGQLRSNPDDAELLRAAGGLYSAYAGAFVQDPARQARLAERAFEYTSRAAGLRREALGTLRDVEQDRFIEIVASIDEGEFEVMFALAQAWMTRIRANPEDLDAVADLPRVQRLLERLSTLDETGGDGSLDMFLGVLLSFREVAMGGDPDPARRHFERALELSERRNLMVLVTYARAFATMTRDESLYRDLLYEVVDADPVEPGRTLMNVIAQEEASALLDAGEMGLGW